MSGLKAYEIARFHWPWERFKRNLWLEKCIWGLLVNWQWHKLVIEMGGRGGRMMNANDLGVSEIKLHVFE